MSNPFRKLVFIINPSSGQHKHPDWEKMISKYLKTSEYEILYTRYAGHSSSILGHFTPHDAVCIVAVGGDGTVSELLPTILRCKAVLGIIPTGSGNGLARHMNIPLNPAKAMQILESGRIQNIDLMHINSHYSCNTSGIGFSALVTKYFGLKGNRGFSSYFKLALKLYKSSPEFSIVLNDVNYTRVWAVEFANSSQLGNNAIVSHLASIQDGIVDILILKKPKFWQIPSMIFMVLSGKTLQMRLSTLIKATEVQLETDNEQHFHIDGEYKGIVKKVDLKMIPSAIQIIH
jgi:diacylglycerol kinase (ATP)